MKREKHARPSTRLSKSGLLIFLLGSKYPSEKAFCVTIGRTVEAIRKTNEYQAEIWCQSSEKSDEFANPIRKPLAESFTSFLWRFNSFRFTKIGYVVSELLLIKYFVRSYRRELFSAKVVTREIYQAYFLMLKGHRNIFLELHFVPKSKLQKLLLKVLFYRIKGIIVLYETQKLSLINDGCPSQIIYVIPMAVPDEFFVTKRSLKKSNEIVYLGRSNSRGIDSNLSVVLSAIESLPLNIAGKLVMRFIGVSKRDLEKAWNSKNSRKINEIKFNLEIIPNVEHTVVPKLLETSIIGIVPYTNDTYNAERFPLKILEYAASRNLIVASDVYKCNGLLDEDKSVFFSPNSIDSLAETLKNALLEEDEERLSAAQEWARNYTYSMRASKILKVLNDA